MTSVWNRTSPRTASLNATSRCAGTRNLMAGFSPAARRCDAAAGGRRLQVPA
jgi:hypothetical protein